MDPLNVTTCYEPGPRVSIIILNLNGYSDTRDCLESLRHVQYPNFDVFVLDNGSSDNSADRLQVEFPSAKVLRSKDNRGFAGGNNLAIKEAVLNGAAYVLLLNNDTIVDSDILTHLVAAGEDNSQVGILGPKILYYSEPQRIWYAGGIVKYATGICQHVGLDEIDQDSKFCCVEDTQFVTGCAMMIKSRILQEIGLLDDGLFAYWEDADFCMRAQIAGYHCIFVPMARVWHKISQTAGSASPFTFYLTTRNHLTWITRHIPFPYKAIALPLTLVRKIAKMLLLVLESPESAVAVWTGIVGFIFQTSGVPRQWLRPKAPLRSTNMSS